MARILGTVLLALPVMAGSFYGVDMVMKSTAMKPTTISSVSSIQTTTDSNNQSFAGGEGLVYRKTRGANIFAAVALKDKSGFLFEHKGRSDRADMFVPSIQSGDVMKVSALEKGQSIAKTLPSQAANTATVNRSAKADALKPVAVTVMARKTLPKPVAVAAAIASDPYIDAVDPKDYQPSFIQQASMKSSWADALVTSAFKVQRSEAQKAKEAAASKEAALQRQASISQAVAITPRILPSGRAFGGFTEGEFQKRELRCMATALYFEARSEPVRGQLAVGQVIMNRVRSPEYPDTICGVIFQGDHRRTGCQFSFACDGKTDRPTNQRLWATSQRLATDLTKGKVWLRDIANSTHYHADYVHPKWRRSMRRLKKIGRHIFYKSPKVSTTNTFQQVRGS